MEWYQLINKYNKNISFKSFKKRFLNDLNLFNVNFNSKYSLKEYFEEFTDLRDLRLGYFYLYEFEKIDKDIINIFKYYIKKEEYFKYSLLEDFVYYYFKNINTKSNDLYKSLDILKQYHYKKDIISEVIWSAQRGLQDRGGFKTNINYNLIKRGYKWCVMHYFNPYISLPSIINIIYRDYFLEYADNCYSKIDGNKLKEKFLRAFK